MEIKYKAVSVTGEWVYTNQLKPGSVFLFYPEGSSVPVEIHEESICLYIGTHDKNFRELYYGDIVNDFGGGIYVPDTEHPDYRPDLVFPPMKPTGDLTRLGTIIRENGTTRIETADLDYAYNVHQNILEECEYVGNQYDFLTEKEVGNG